MVDHPTASEGVQSEVVLNGQTRRHLAQLACIVVGVLLVAHATFRGAYADLDAFAYLDWYESFKRLDWRGFLDGASAGIYFDSQTPYRFEVGFAAFAFACASLGFSPEGFFFACASASILPKVFIIGRYSSAPLATLAWYVSWYYVLLDMNAIRAGIAVAILLIGMRHVLSGNATFLLFVGVAFLFHVSAITGLLLLVIRWVRVDARLLAAMVAVAAVLSFYPIVVVLEPLAAFSSKLQEYLALLREGQVYASINVFNVITLARLMIFVILLYALSRIRMSRVEQLGVGSMALSLVLYFSLASFPVVAGRLSEFIGVFQIFVAPIILRAFTPPSLPRVGFFLLILAQFWAVTYHSRLADFFYFTDVSWLRVPLVSTP